ncbi:hypothetical protein RJT34_16353 [Clitoria ternatea]|uniref:Uncharacterized protein n=1 Tax=Clitoria ternatea TaxID=43366 RepID=A0AAN9J704_CLITE
MNSACLLKLAWEIKSGQKELWIEVFKGKYGENIVNFTTYQHQKFRVGILEKVLQVFGLRYHRWNGVHWEMDPLYLFGRNHGCGGLLHDHSGSWLKEFSKRIGFTSAYLAEPLGSELGDILDSDVIGPLWPTFVPC